jgi:hypothetical protein
MLTNNCDIGVKLMIATTTNTKRLLLASIGIVFGSKNDEFLLAFIG